jgi:hypothetical protein
MTPLFKLSQVRAFFFKDLNRVHSQYKRDVINKFNSKDILEICPGKSDLSEYSNFNGNLFGIEMESQNSKNNIRECCKNVKINCRSLKSYSFSESNLVFDREYDMIISSNLYSFFRSKESTNTLIDFVNCSLKNGGKLVISMISRLPEQSSIEFFNNEIMYIIEQNKLFLNGIHSESDITNAKIVSRDFLVDFLAQKGFVLIDEQQMANNLQNYEKQVCDLMSIFIFEKGNDILNLPKYINEINETSGPR